MQRSPYAKGCAIRIRGLCAIPASDMVRATWQDLYSTSISTSTGLIIL